MMIKPNRILTAGALAATLAAMTAGCSTGGPYQTTSLGEPTVSAPAMPAYVADYGTVDSIQMVNAGAGNGVAGAIAGGVVGGLLGHQVGGGSGQTAATIAGAVGGAAVGNEIDRRTATTGQYQIGVRLDSGNYLTIVQDANMDLRVGDRVRVENGHVYRV